jgi:amino acid adenylation domain-containing protein
MEVENKPDKRSVSIAHLINSLNNTESDLDGKNNFIECFYERCKDNANLALIFDNEEVPYKQLNSVSNQFAHFFRKKGISSGSLVGICLERDVNLVAAVLGVLKAGACYVPLDPFFPESRLSYMINDSGLRYIVSVQKLTDRFTKGKDVDVILIDNEIETIKLNDSSNPAEPINGDALAYTIYTSGSTGKPKGVQIHHKALLNFLLSMKKLPGLTQKDRLLAITTLSFDISCLELYLPLIAGATVVLASSDTSRDGNKLIRYINDKKVSMMQATPATYQMLLDLGWKNNTVMKLLCGGEAMTIDLANKLQSLCGEVWNMYGPTETTVWSSVYRLRGLDDKPLIGRPIDNTSMIILDENLKPVDRGENGDLYIGGSGLSRGYLNRKDLSDERFVPCPFPELKTEKIYKTGDVCRYTEDGNIEYIGRSDFQVKIRGFRIELGEIENTILQSGTVKNCVVTVREDIPGFKKLIAYIIETGEGNFSSDEMKNRLKAGLPDYMVPDIFVSLKSFSLTPNGKIDRKALPKPGRNRPELSTPYIKPETATEKILAMVSSDLLAIDKVGADDNFFDLGGNSLLGIRAVNVLLNEHDLDLPIVKLFEYPVISKLAGYLDKRDKKVSIVDQINERATRQRIGRFTNDPMSDGIAIIGMSGRFPGADTIDALWENLCNGKESISRFTKDELGPGIDEDLLNDPDYILARGIINDADKFDAAFFGISPNEAKVMDPQHRVFLELAYQSLENAGYDPEGFPGMIGVYAGAGDNFYYTTNLLHHKNLINMVGKVVVGYGNFKDYIATRTSYHLNLTGPSISSNIGCSTTLLTVDSAFHGLINYECDMALAGGIDIYVPQKSGFLYQLNGTFAKDGHCRPFDSEATGTMFCDGAGIVVLKRLKDALRDRDTIYAVIRGSAKNNDGSNKASFLAPSSEGQYKVIAMAQAMANISADDIGYVEAHGTGTPIGDPIEIEGLTKAFRLHTNRNQFCYLGSIKGNIGHPTNAAGIAGLIKAALCLYREKIPATMHFKTPNPRLNIGETPFIIADRLIEWKKTNKPRIAGVSSFGFGGTNVHAVLEESPIPEKPAPSKRPFHLFPLSAKTEKALDRLTSAFVSFFKEKDTQDLADIAYTLKTGRKNHAFRRFVIADTRKNAVANFEKLDPGFANSQFCDVKDKKICFMFPGQGSQYVGMGINLYDTEQVFRDTVDRCAAVLNKYLKKDILEILFAENRTGADEFDSLMNTYYTQPAIFTIEYSLSRLLMSWGIFPSVMVGHSIGEFVCATLSGIFELDDALRLIALRGKLISDLPHGSMLSIRKNLNEIKPLLPDTIQPAAHNSPDLCVVAGPTEAVAAFSKNLEEKGIMSKQLHTSHAFHSAMMDPAVEAFTAEVKKVPLSKPSIPFLSTLTNEWIDENNQIPAEYWGKHMRQPVLFSSAITMLLNENKYVFLEIGPRSTLSTLARQHGNTLKNPIVSSMSDSHENFEECRALQSAIGSLWLNGVSVDWKLQYADEIRYKVPLPLYSFEKTRYWVDPPLETQNFIAQTESRESSTVDENKDAGSEQSSPAGGLDETIVALTKSISEVFGRDISDFGANSTFIEMGMDSLFLTQVANKIREQFKIKITFGHLLKDYPNIKKLSEFIHKSGVSTVKNTIVASTLSGNGTNKAVAAEPPVMKADTVRNETSLPRDSLTLEKIILEQNQTISRLVWLLENSGHSNEVIDGKINKPAETGKPFTGYTSHSEKSVISKPLSINPTYPQKGIWFSSKLSDELSASYNESVSIKFSGKLPVSLLKEAVSYLIKSHEALCAVFSVDGGAMLIVPEISVTVRVDELGPGDSIEKIAEIIKNEQSVAFNLEKGPLFRVKIIKTGELESIVVLTAHHSICDGWSLDVLIFDLCEYCYARMLQRPLKEDPVHSFVDFIQMINARTDNDDYKRMKRFWLKKTAAGFPLQEIPADYPRASVKRFDADRVDITIQKDIFTGLQRIAKQFGCSIYTIVLSGLSILLYRIFGNKNFVIALAMAEQSFLSRNRLVGNCVDLLPFISDISVGQSFKDFLSNTQAEIISIMDNHEYTLIELMRDMEKRPDENRVSHATSGFTHVKMFENKDLPAADYSISYRVNPKAYENFELYFIALESADTLELKCSYNATLFKRETIQKWLGFLETIFSRIVQNHDQLLDELFILPTDEAARLSENFLKNRMRNNNAIPPDTKTENQMEKRLLEVWQNLFGKKNIHVKSNFFELGGHSLMAAELFARVEKEFKKTLPLSILYKHPTVGELAKQIGNEPAGRKWNSLVPIRAEGKNPPLFLVHGAEGNILLFRELTGHLGNDQPVYGLQSFGLDGRNDFNPEFKSTAAAYIKEIKEFQSDGPYYIGGYCLGGTIAFEMARQFTAQGDTVAFICMFENYNVQIMKWPQPAHLQLTNKILNIYFHMRNLLAAKKKSKFFLRKAAVEWSRFKIKNKIRLTQIARKFRKDPETAYKHLMVDKAFDDALIDYIPEPYKGKIAVFIAKERFAGFNDPWFGWKELALGGIDIYELPVAPRGSLVEPYVEVLAEKLTVALEKAREDCAIA